MLSGQFNRKHSTAQHRCCIREDAVQVLYDVYATAKCSAVRTRANTTHFRVRRSVHWRSASLFPTTIELLRLLCTQKHMQQYAITNNYYFSFFNQPTFPELQSNKLGLPELNLQWFLTGQMPDSDLSPNQLVKNLGGPHWNTDEDCRQAEELKQLDEASRFHLGRQRPTLCRHLLWLFAIQQQSTAPQSGHALLTQVRSMCSWTLPCVSSLVPSVLHLSHGFQCSPTLNRQP